MRRKYFRGRRHIMSQTHQGIDIVDVYKFQRIFHNSKNFRNDIFTEKERDCCLSKKQSSPYFAGCFAAKEASLKALGIGISGIGMTQVFKEIEVIPDSSGRATLSFFGWAAKICKKRQINKSSVSISFSARYTIAYVTLTGKQN